MTRAYLSWRIIQACSNRVPILLIAFTLVRIVWFLKLLAFVLVHRDITVCNAGVLVLSLLQISIFVLSLGSPIRSLVRSVWHAFVTDLVHCVHWVTSLDRTACLPFSIVFVLSLVSFAWLRVVLTLLLALQQSWFTVVRL